LLYADPIAVLNIPGYQRSYVLQYHYEFVNVNVTVGVFVPDRYINVPRVVAAIL
jgi:hypothetical protein